MFFLLSAAGLPAQIAITNPSLPDSERILYAEKSGKETRTVEQRLRLKTENGKSWYEYVANSPDSDVLIRLEKDTLFAYSSETTTRGEDATIRRTSQVIKTSVTAAADELVIADLNSLLITLRGFPWERAKYAKLVFLGQGGPRTGASFAIELNVLGKETITVNGKSYECWKVQMGISGFFSAFVGKSYYWYSVQPPHFLVRSEGTWGMPGTQKQVMELLSYEAGK